MVMEEERPKDFGNFASVGARTGSLTIYLGVTSLKRYIVKTDGKTAHLRGRRSQTAATGRACLILRGKKIEYAAIGELLGGNTRQGIGPSSAYCRVLPDIAA
jgi:hypothetical protein